MRTVLIILMCITLIVLPSAARAQEQAKADTVVLDTSGFWRVHVTLRPPVVAKDAGVEALKSACRTEAPSADWTRADFLDVDWARRPGAPFASHNSWSNVSKHNVGFVAGEHCSPCLAQVSLRGKFHVDDPRRVKGLSLSLAYRGGIVAYVNGTEVGRGHLNAGKIAPATLAEPYPIEAYVKPDGELLGFDQGEKRKEIFARWERRTRRLNLNIPTRLLRRGTNVLAIEVRRAPYHEVMYRKTRNLGRGNRAYYLLWSTCGLVTARLSAEDARGLAPNAARPKGFQVWNSPAASADFDMDWGDATEPLRPVRIVAARGGLFSGKVVVGSDAAVAGLKATASALKRRGGGAIPASHVLVRYALPTSWEPGAQRRYAASAALFDGLSPTPPDEIPVREKPWVRGNWVHPGQPKTRFGAVVPVWVTVDVPRDARVGDYEGTLTVSARGVQAVRVPVRLEVCTFTLPPTDRLSTTVDFIQSPESVALQYKVPMWSEKHFALIAESFKRLGEVGNRSIYIPLICRTNFGNEQSMVRWIRKQDGTYRHDFSIVARYVDLALKHMGKPRMVVIQAWDVFAGNSNYRGAVNRGGEVSVSMLDEKTGEVRTIKLPPYRDAKGPDASGWKPLGDGLRALMKRRGLDDAMMLGISSDSQPTREVVTLFKRALPGVPWMRHGHSRRRDTQGEPIAYQCLVWTPKFVADADGTPLRGWARQENWSQFCRSREVYPLTMARLLGEMNIQGEQRGFGRIGLDFWRVLETKRGRRRRRFAIQARFPESDWRNLDWMIHDFVPPGPAGALSSVRLVMMREGVQECEARILIERALTTPALRKKLDAALVKRCEAIVAERTRVTTLALDNHFACGFGKPSTAGHGWWSSPGQVGPLWYIGQDRHRLAKDLYTAAGELANALNGK